MKLNQSGFSLLGVMCAVAIIGVVAMGASDMLTTNQTYLSTAKNKRNRDRIVTNVLHLVIENLPLLQRHFDPSDGSRDALLDL